MNVPALVATVSLAAAPFALAMVAQLSITTQAFTKGQSTYELSKARTAARLAARRKDL